MKRFLLFLVSIALFCGGGFVVYLGLNQPPEPTPDLKTAIQAPVNQKPVGPKEVKVGDASIAPANMEPKHLMIPSINSYAYINNDKDHNGLVNGSIEKDGNFVLPPPKQVTRWVDGADVLSDKGHIVIAGHVKYNSTHGALFDLAKVPLGGYAFVSDKDGNTQAFQLDRSDPIEKSVLPESIWDKTGPKKLVVITCGGKLIPVGGGRYKYESNIVSVFKPVSAPVVKKVS